jgi:hypothetical protein
LNADSLDSAPPEVKNTPCMFGYAMVMSLEASSMAGILDDPEYAEK